MQARSSALAALGSLQPRAFGSLNRVETLDSVSNYYLLLVQSIKKHNLVQVTSGNYVSYISGHKVKRGDETKNNSRVGG